MHEYILNVQVLNSQSMQENAETCVMYSRLWT